MNKKSIKRKTTFQKPKNREVEWESIGKSVGEKLDIEEIMDIQDRTITFGVKKTPLEKVTDDLQDKSSTTSQYVSLVNSYLTGKKSQIEKIIELTNNFEEEVQNLKSDNTKIAKLRDTPIHEFNSLDLKKLAQDLLQDREQRRDTLTKLKNDIIEAEKALNNVDSRLENVNEQILERKLHRKKHDSNSKMIKELSTLVEKYDKKSLSAALKKLNVPIGN